MQGFPGLVLACCWVGLGPPTAGCTAWGAWGLRQPAGGRVNPWWYQASRKIPKWLLPVLVSSQKKERPGMASAGVSVPRRSPSCFPPLWQSLLEQQVGLTQTLQTTASALGLGVCESLCVPFKSGVAVSCSPPGLPAGCQRQIFWELIFLLQVFWAGKPNVGSDPSLLGEDFCNCVTFLLFVGLQPGGCRSWLCCLYAPPTQFFLYIFSCGKIVGNLSIGLQVVLKDSCWVSSWNLVCSWWEVSSGSFLLCYLGHTPYPYYS